MMRVLVLLPCLLLPLYAQANNARCEAYALWREARSEGILTQRGVLDVIRNRMRVTGQSACVVLRKPQQFPYFKDGIKPVDKGWLVRYYFVGNMQSVLPKNYLYFNDSRPHKWGRNTIRIGAMYFST